MVPTGDDTELSAPINFDTLRPQCLPLDRPDAHTLDSEVDVIRVFLSAAAPFVTALQQREERAFPHFYAPSAIDTSLNPYSKRWPTTRNADEYSDAIIHQVK